MGPLAQAVAQRAQAFAMSVAYTDRQPHVGVTHRYVETVEALAAEVDHLVIAAAPEAVTPGWVGAEALRALGPTGHVVNVSATTALDAEVLTQALKDKAIAGAALDVFWEAPRVPAALRAMPQVVLTPHIGHATLQGQHEMVAQAIAQLRAFFKGDAAPPVTA